ncbi:MAG: UDP-N-acetylglucosamine 2-epimerase (non-hydrolyzing), partial [Planctomycetota bacterium]
PTNRSRDNLLGEGVPSSSVLVTGNTVIDALQHEVARQHGDAGCGVIDRVRTLVGSGYDERPVVLVTGHRRENFGDGFEQICSALVTLAGRFRDHLFVYPVHLNPNVQRVVGDRLGEAENIRLLPPQPYSEFVCLLDKCRLILTDSGGVQEEAPSLGKPVLVMRDTTERPEGVEAGVVRLVGPVEGRIVDEATRLLTDADAYRAMSSPANPYGDGHAATRIVDAVADFLS